MTGMVVSGAWFSSGTWSMDTSEPEPVGPSPWGWKPSRISQAWGVPLERSPSSSSAAENSS